MNGMYIEYGPAMKVQVGYQTCYTIFHKNKVYIKACAQLLFDIFLGTKSYKCSVDSESLASAKEWSTEKPCPVLEEFKDLAVTVMKEDNINAPNNIDNALLLYRHLKGVLKC